MSDARRKVYNNIAEAAADDDSILDLTPDSANSFQYSQNFLDKSHGVLLELICFSVSDLF